MKLSEMNTKQASACLAELAVPVGNLLKSETVRAWYDENKKKNADVFAALSLLPALLRDNYDDTASIIAALCGKAKKEIDEQPISQTIADVRGSIDKDLISFFTSQPKPERVQ